jgi:hypothetical protein
MLFNKLVNILSIYIFHYWLESYMHALYMFMKDLIECQNMRIEILIKVFNHLRTIEISEHTKTQTKITLHPISKIKMSQ